MNRAEVDAHRTELSERLARLEEKTVMLLFTTKEIKSLISDQNGRVRDLEKKQSWLIGGLGAVTFLFSSLIAWLKGEL
jgi:hypothetical protein